ncbi:hypothetical protein [Cetobacterium sp.]|uniref:hypothetical protein n=1 Tax=Cetobacterium sp. TaxID=2071632 RepID=UPI003EE46790
MNYKINKGKLEDCIKLFLKKNGIVSPAIKDLLNLQCEQLGKDCPSDSLLNSLVKELEENKKKQKRDL